MSQTAHSMCRCIEGGVDSHRRLPRIFISYRRESDWAVAGRLYDRLAQRFGRDSVFMDVSTIEPGVDFARVIGEQVAACDALLAILGPNWSETADAHGHRRLDAPDDFVRREIAQALQRNILVIPVLVRGGSVPAVERLPDSLKGLAGRNALGIRDSSFDDDVERLLRSLPPPRTLRLSRGVALLAILATGSLVGVWYWANDRTPRMELTSPTRTLVEPTPSGTRPAITSDRLTPPSVVVAMSMGEWESLQKEKEKLQAQLRQERQENLELRTRLALLERPQPEKGQVAIAWPAVDVVGLSPDLIVAGYVIYVGRTPTELTPILRVGNVTAADLTLSVGTWYYAVSAVSGAGAESALSDPRQLVLGAL